METHWTRRAMVGAALSAVAAPAVGSIASAQERATASAAAKGQLTDQSLGTLLKALGLETTTSEQRYDFVFKTVIEDAEWELSMSAVLSQDGTSLWIMAWLDELPKSAADVPRTALLRLLSDNDKLGKGKFFAYIAGNQRFVLQRSMPNENMTQAAFRAALMDLGESVVATHAHWSVANWASTSSPDPANVPRTSSPVKGSAPQSGGVTGAARPTSTATRPTAAKTAPATGRPVQSAVNESKFNSATRK